MANHGYCKNCWWHKDGICYMQGVNTNDDSCCPGYVNRHRLNKEGTIDGLLNEWKEKIIMEEEWKIGEIRQVNGEWYQCIIGHCHQCSFDEAGTCKFIGNPYCAYRNDKKLACFKKLEKVGEPYKFGRVLMQQYRIFTNAYFPKGFSPAFVLDKYDKVISIEIEQNKEDMKKKRKVFKTEDKVEQQSTEKNPEQAENIADRFGDNAFENVEVQLEETVNELKMRDFNLEEAKAGKPVCTRDGRKARIICFDRDWEKHIVALVSGPLGESVHYYLSNGKIDFDKQNDEDLMMLPEKKEAWVNLYPCDCMGRKRYPTKEEALKNAVSDVIATVKIEYEE